MKEKEIFKICFSAVMLSMAVICEIIFKFVIILQMPNGGGISLAMLPLFTASVVCGWKYGLGVGLGFGLIDCFLIDGYAFHPASFVLDYLIGFMSVAAGACYRKKILSGRKGFFAISFLLVILIRWLASGFSGVINAGVWGYDGELTERIFGSGKSGVFWLYLFSFVVYNLPYLAVTYLLSVLTGLAAYDVLFMKFASYADPGNSEKEEKKEGGTGFCFPIAMLFVFLLSVIFSVIFYLLKFPIVV